MAGSIGRSLAVHWRGACILGTDLVIPSGAERDADGVLGEWLEAWNRGKHMELPESLLDWSRTPPRTRAILQSLEHTSFGRTCSYADIASWSGIPKGYQAAGQAMARNPFVLLVPCHRVLTTTGGLGGYSAGGPEIKGRLLAHEGSRS